MHGKRVALVTGATRGIGRGIAEVLTADGITVCAVGTGKEGPSYGDGIYIQCDISKEADRIRAIDRIYDTYGRLDILVNNAGVAPLVRGDLLDMPEESLDRLIGINLKGTFFLTQYAAKRMIKQKDIDTPRMIITITSISADTASISRGEYCISKAGLAMTTKLFADRLAPEGICVYEVRPGIIETDMTAVVKDRYDALIEGGLLPIKRMGQPSDVGKIVLGLTSGLFAYSTGDIIHADGGFHISRL